MEEENQSFVIKDNILVGKKYNSEVETKCVSKLILDAFNESPNFIGQIDLKTGKEITFGEMKERSIRCALWLEKQGIGKDDVVCISTPNQYDDYVPLLATFYVGAIYNPWYHELSASEASYFFKLIEPKIIFAYKKTISSLARVAKTLNITCKFICYGDHPDFESLDSILSKQTAKEVSRFRYHEIDDPETRIGAIYFSSGTTGIQKGTALSYETIVNNRTESAFIESRQNMLWYSSMSWISGTNLIILSIRKGATRFIHKNFNAEETAKVIEKHKIHWFFATPTMLTQISKAKVFQRYNFSSLQFILFGGSKTSANTLEDVHKALPHTLVSNLYGLTEAGGCISVQSRNKKRIDSIGQIVKTVQMKIVDVHTGSTLGPDESGEICVKLQNCMLGYYKNPEETKKMFDVKGWLHTGDYGYYDESGEVMLIDRLKAVIITQNYHVAPSQIEEILLQHPEVLEAAVLGVPHEIDVEQPLAFVKVRPGAKVTESELRDLPTKYNAYFRLSGGVIFVDKIPYTGTGKKCISELKKMAKLI